MCEVGRKQLRERKGGKRKSGLQMPSEARQFREKNGQKLRTWKLIPLKLTTALYVLQSICVSELPVNRMPPHPPWGRNWVKMAATKPCTLFSTPGVCTTYSPFKVFLSHSGATGSGFIVLTSWSSWLFCGFCPFWSTFCAADL